MNDILKHLINVSPIGSVWTLTGQDSNICDLLLKKFTDIIYEQEYNYIEILLTTHNKDILNNILSEMDLAEAIVHFKILDGKSKKSFVNSYDYMDLVNISPEFPLPNWFVSKFVDNETVFIKALS